MPGSGENKKYAAPGATALVLLILAFTLWGLESLFPLRALVWHWRELLWLPVVAAAALGQGAVVFRLWRGDRLEIEPGLKLAVLAGLGLGVLSLEVLAAAAAGFMNRPFLTVLTVLVLAVSALAGRREAMEAVSRAAAEANRLAGEVRLPLGAAVCAAVISFPLVLVPSRAFDALSYHLEVPMRYLQAGGMVDLPANLYSYSPLLTQMLYGLAMGLAGPALAGLIYYLFFLLTLWVIWCGGRPLFGNSGAAWATAMLSLTPVFLMEVPQSGADWSMTFFLVTALFLAAGDDRSPRRLLLAGALAGMAAGCRHQALGYGVVLIPLSGLAADLAARRAAAVKNWLLLAVSAFAAAAPWYLKNLLQTGDPLYPLLATLTGKTAYHIQFADTLTGARPVELLWSWILVPYQAAFDPTSLSMSATTGILPLALLVLLPFTRLEKRGNRFLLLWTILAYAAWHLTFRTFRYAMPVMAVALLWAGSVLAQHAGGKTRWAAAVRWAAILSMLANAAVFIGLSDYINRNIGAALGTTSPGRYLTRTYDPYPAIDFLNNLSPPPGKVLFVGEMRGFYSRFRREVPSHNAPNRLLSMIRDGSSPAEAAHRLRRQGFTHLLYNPGEYDRMAVTNRNAPLWRLDGEQKQVLGRFLSEEAAPVFTANGIAVLELGHE